MFSTLHCCCAGNGCKVAGFMTVFASQLSIFTLSLLTVERWITIRRALYNNRVDLPLAIKIMCAGWAYALVLATLPLFGISSYSSTRLLFLLGTTVENNFYEYQFIKLLYDVCVKVIMARVHYLSGALICYTTSVVI